MKKLMIIALLTSGICFAYAENPVLKLHPSNVTFYVSFDKGTPEADMASGESMPEKSKAAYQYGPGVFEKKALRSGTAKYPAAENIDFTKPGTIICWVAPVGWTMEKNEKQKGYGWSVFHAHGKNYQYIMGKMPGQPTYAQHMNFYFYYPPSKAVNCVNFNSAGFAYPGEWKMLTAAWDANSAVTCVNKKYIVGKKNVIRSNVNTFSVGPFCNKNFPMLVDEIVVLDKALSKEEITKIYEESLKLISAQKGKNEM